MMNFFFLNKPFENLYQNYIELFNEICLYIITLSYTAFTDIVSSSSTKNGLGYLSSLIIILNILANIIIVAYGIVKSIVRFSKYRAIPRMKMLIKKRFNKDK